MYKRQLQDCLDGERSYSLKKLFWGYGIYKNGKIFWIYAFDQIYFKTDEKTKQEYIKLKSKIFSYEKQGKEQTMRYYTLPEEVLENKEELQLRIEKALNS